MSLVRTCWALYCFNFSMDAGTVQPSKYPPSMILSPVLIRLLATSSSNVVANSTGTYLDNTPRSPADPALFEGNVYALNDVALRLHGVAKGLGIHWNDFRDNATTIEIDGGGDALASDVRGNHFSEYEGYDLNGDGIGDVPFRVSALSAELADAHPALKFFHRTAAMNLIDAIAHAVPVLESRTLLADNAPLARAPEVPLP